MRVEGQGLHTASRAAVVLARAEGPVVLEVNGVATPRDALRVVSTERSTTVADDRGRGRVATVEHLFAAFAGLGIHAGVRVVIEGPELPLLDGGARAWAEALRALSASASAAASASPLVIVRDEILHVGASRYELSPPRDDAPHAVRVEVAIDFGDPRLAPEAAWSGDADDFLLRIAPARTFGFEREIGELLARGLAGHVSPESVVVLGEGRILSAGAPFEADEPARHKLLDLLGDLWLHGGPPRGRLRASRPGHAATHEAMRIARERGIVTRVA